MKTNILKKIAGCVFITMFIISFAFVYLYSQNDDICDESDTEKECGRKIMEAVQDEPSPDQLETESTMLIVKGDSKNPTLKKFKTYSKKYTEEEGKTLIEFTYPSKIKVLRYSYENKEDDVWLKLTSGSAKRITGSGKQGAFQNSHFTYEDMESRNLDEYELIYEGDSKQKVEGKKSDCYKVTGKKISGEESAYSKADFYIRKSDLLIVRADIYDEEGNPHKTMRILKTKKVKGNDVYTMTTKVGMAMIDDPTTEDVNEGKNQYTIIELNDIKVDDNTNIDESKFRKESL